MDKQIVLVTGASGGIGMAISELLLLNGYAVVLQYNNTYPSLSDHIRNKNDLDFLFVKADLTSESDTASMIQAIHKRFGHISVLINCAGKALKQMIFEDTNDQMLMDLFETNVAAPMRLTRLLLPDLRENEGAIINISSMWGVSGAACEVIYSTTKSAINGFTKSLAKELAPSHVTVNAVAPGFIMTRMNDGISEEDKEQFRLNTPLETLGTPDDVAKAVRFLIESRFITGQVLSVDGGINI